MPKDLLLYSLHTHLHWSHVISTTSFLIPNKLDTFAAPNPIFFRHHRTLSIHLISSGSTKTHTAHSSICAWVAKTDPYVAGSPATQNPRLVILSYICLRSWRPIFSLVIFLCDDGKRDPTVEWWKKKADRHQIEWDRPMEDQNLRRDGRNKRVYTYVNMQRRKSCIL